MKMLLYKGPSGAWHALRSDFIKDISWGSNMGRSEITVTFSNKEYYSQEKPDELAKRFNTL